MSRGPYDSHSLRTDGGEEDEEETPLQQLVAGVVIALIFLVGFGLLAVGYPWFWVAFPVGFAGVLPAALALAKLYEHSRDSRASRPSEPTVTDEHADALAALRARYARGELDEEEFEHRLERLLETETVDDARAHVTRERERISER
ncbi:Short C-terminal domain-containing protein [Halogranum rubrum]|uniref:Short C-terminal domain-containing protein n=1 Tax=Halogranum rubrum TaxID=553466 RepID=A0A1I4E4U0_9EURY|nr:SHOCT domain-containing protein [Halogranum rubrum]SFL00775.1 Short C-terminal domain-containing protein [Halogranum rubrum]